MNESTESCDTTRLPLRPKRARPPTPPGRRGALLRLSAPIVAASLLSIGCGGNSDPPPAPARIDTLAPGAWVDVALTAVQKQAAAAPPGLAPMEDSRLYAMAFAAAHDALNAIDRRYKPFLSDLSAPTADPTSAVAAAVHDVLVVGLPGQVAYIDGEYSKALAAVAAGAAKDAGVALGQKTAKAMLDARVADGAANAQGPYSAPADPGVYQPTIPVNAATFVNWGAVKPFVMTSGDQFRPPPNYSVTDPAYTADFNEVKAIGSAASTTRTADQSAIAKFWLENTSGTWARIAGQFATAKSLNGWDQMRLYAVLEIAQADAYIGCLEAKYHYRFWRPITAIRSADIDGNADTLIDANWVPFDFVTPPVPDYPSGHSASAGAGAAVFKRLYGDSFSLAYTSTSLPGVTRNYTSFSQVEQEIGLSRIYVGYHFRNAVTAGIAQGEAIGDYVAQRTLLPK